MQYFYLYIVQCADQSYYVGYTDNLEKRLSEHNAGIYPGYTSTRLPVVLVYSMLMGTRYNALAAEHKIKKWSRKKKEALIGGDWDLLIMLAKKQF